MSSSPNITVLIPCKNEVKNIAACIASARLIATEVLVADSGSTDGTLELAHRDADRVVEREYIDSGDFKNWAIPQAANEWVFILDADERITSDLAKEIGLALNAKSASDANAADAQWAYSVPRRNFFLGYPIDYGDWARDRVTRLFRRDHCRYKLHTDHAEIEVPTNRFGKLTAKLVHYTAWDLVEYLEKMHHYAHQQALLWQQNGKRPRIRNVVFNAPMRFLRGYVLRLGFLDGMIGFYIAGMTAYYSFVKQFLFWQMHHGRSLEDFEKQVSASFATTDESRDQAAGRAA